MVLRNPLAGLASPFTQKGRTSGQEILSKYGLGDDHDMLGLGLELATDPFSLIGGGMALKGLRGLNVLGKGSKIGKVADLAGALVRRPGEAVDAWKALRQGGTREAWAKVAAMSPEARQAAGTGMMDLAPQAASPRAPFMERAIGKLADPNIRRTAKGLGLVQLLTMGRDSRNERDPYAQQYEGMYQ